MRAIIEQHKGRVVNSTGDALLAEFPSAIGAASAVVEIQGELEGRDIALAPERRMPFRIGVHLGDVIEQEDGTIYGDGVNIAARMEALAEGGWVCVSSSVFDTEELISQLSKISGLDVIARTSVMAYKGKDETIDEIGRELKVGTVLEGSVRKAENQVRITAQLIDVESQAHLWAQNYDRELKGVFAIQSDIAKGVIEALKVRLGAAERGRLEKAGTENPEAVELYLKGLYHWNKQTAEGIAKSIEYYQQAIAQDPTHADAYASLAFAYDIQGFYGLAPESDAFPRAKAVALSAPEVDRDHPLALVTLAEMTVVDWDWSQAERLYRRALALEPSSSVAHGSYGII
jgi:TolB-like protein